MTHKYDRVSKVITETLGENYENLDHGNLVHFAYAILEEFEKEDENENLEESITLTKNPIEIAIKKLAGNKIKVFVNYVDAG